MLRDQKFISEEKCPTTGKGGKRGILNILFGRTTIILAILAFQFVLMFYGISLVGTLHAVYLGRRV